MAGELDLSTLIASMEPVLQSDTYVFATIDRGADYSAAEPLMVFNEGEGTTLICSADEARDLNARFEYPCRMITLNIHSSLEAVGFLAAITNCLAAEGMSVNPVSAFYHDHLFVPADRAEDAMKALKSYIAAHRD